jgi:hypothetical protein
VGGMNMNEDFELAKISLHNANDLIDIKEYPVVDAVLLAPIRAIPIIGDLIDSGTNKVLENFQEKKEKELINVILKDGNLVTSDMVNDIEFIINFNKVMEAVRRLAVNDKVRFFGNLIRNGYLSGLHIENSLFEEYLNILNTISYREIQYLLDYKLYCEDRSKTKKGKSQNKSGSVSYNEWGYFRNDYTKQKSITSSELSSVFMRIKQTGFIDEEFETETGDVDEDDNTFNSLSVDSTGYYIDKSFLVFYDMVLKIDDI